MFIKMSIGNAIMASVAGGVARGDVLFTRGHKSFKTKRKISFAVHSYGFVEFRRFTLRGTIVFKHL